MNDIKGIEINGDFGDWGDDDWNTLIKAIMRGNCILMLGPDASTVEENGTYRPLTEILANQLAEKIRPEDKTQIDVSNLAQVSQYYIRTKKKDDLLTKVSRFYEDRPWIISSLHTDLAALPFYFVITTALDKMFYDALDRENKIPHVGRYNFRDSPQVEVDMGTCKNPLVFYLYGNIDDENSLLLAESDILEYLYNMISRDTPLQENIRSELEDEDKIFLFLGFGFRHWYLRILIYILKACKKSSRSFAFEQFIPGHIDELQKTVFFFNNNDYNIHIFPKDLQRFAGELKRRAEQFPNIDPLTPEVFICYAHEDKKYAEELYQNLEAKGLMPWLDNKKLKPGDYWEERIEEAIKQVDYFVVLISKSLNNGMQGFVAQEIDLALKRREIGNTNKRFIIPVKIEECDVVEKLEKIHAIDLYAKNGIKELIDNIQEDFKKKDKQ
ncbi:MAG: toll/interleukin-1 receptor domain-containing protein [Candidatus Aminicenantes bacterium]|nr:toll/interleukin-1 receptor domain-containing protein [Candidatus Aminicenantes bacterium]